MKLLLDSHIWIWLLESPNRVSKSVLQQITSADELVLSAACIWEIAIKAQMGKLEMNISPSALRDEALNELAAIELPIRTDHALAASVLPLIHRDPFDRILIAQAAQESLTLVTADDTIRQYGGALLWAV